jgi:superfamily I DNA/RNA helicase
LTEFLRTGCLSSDGKELFPPNLIITFEMWQRNLHRSNSAPLPANGSNILANRRALAISTASILSSKALPKLFTIFVDESQDLLEEEVTFIRNHAEYVFFVGDDRQRIYGPVSGISAIRALSPCPDERTLPFHYRLAPEICEMADRILVPSGVKSLAETEHYEGPRPGRISVSGPLSRAEQMTKAAGVLHDQIRVYGDRIREGDRLGVIVPRKDDREAALKAFQALPELADRCQIVRAKSGDDDDRRHITAIDPSKPILILTAQGAKGLEFRGVQWLFSDDLEGYYTPELYYTVVTRAKTSLDIYYTNKFPDVLAQAHSEPASSIWE